MINGWRDRFGEGKVKICKCHAKIARVWTQDRWLLLRGSMNLNFNPRFENFDLTEGGEDFDLVERIERELPTLPRRYSNFDAEQATGVSKAFEQSTLEMFRGTNLSPWKPNGEPETWQPSLKKWSHR